MSQVDTQLSYVLQEHKILEHLLLYDVKKMRLFWSQYWHIKIVSRILAFPTREIADYLK